MPHPTTDSAYGIWSLNEVRDAVRGGNWPVLGGTAISEVFSTYLYTGNGSTQTITNGIDLDGEGGLVWIKDRDNSNNHRLHDSGQAGINYSLSSNLTSESGTVSNSITSFNSDGFGIGSNSTYNGSGSDFVSWTFRKAPKFFDVQTFTTTYNVDPNVISHNLGGELGCAIFKQLDSTGQGENWIVYHRSLGTTTYLRLNANAAQLTDSESFVSVDNNAGTISFGYPMSTVSDRLVSGGAETTNWVGYFFAHNNGDGEFGPTADQDIIKCGSYTGTGTANNKITLGWEPQWLLLRCNSTKRNWLMYDNMRGLVSNGNDAVLFPNLSSAENPSGYILDPLSDGFSVGGSALEVNGSGQNYIYIAIRAESA